jgi:hypothetical protein
LSMQQMLKEIIKETIAPLFKAKDFKKRGNNFAKDCGEFALTVNIQSSRWNTPEEVESTINTGIFTEKLFGTFYDFAPPQFPTEVNSVLRQRITELKNMPDHWYKLNSDSNIEELKKQIKADIETVIFPYFEQFNGIEDVIKEMENNEEQGIKETPHFLTILYHAYGYSDKAEKRIKESYMRAEYDSQKEYTKELAERLGIW